MHVGPLVAQLPEFFRAQLGERVLDLHAAAQAGDILCAVAAVDVFPARVLGPVFFDLLGHFRHFLGLVATPPSYARRMARSNMPNSPFVCYKNKDLHGLKAPTFHDAERGFKKCCIAPPARTERRNCMSPGCWPARTAARWRAGLHWHWTR